MQLILLILIALSSLSILFLILSKISEIKSGKASTLVKSLADYDPAVKKVAESVRVTISSWNLARVINLLKHLSFKIFHYFGTVGLYISEHYSRISSRIRGKKEIKGGGVVSFFLKNMSESERENTEHKSQNMEHGE